LNKISEYSPLGQFLEKQLLQGNIQVSLSFQEIERIINRELPPTARNNKNWWANSRNEKSRQCSAWLNYGWSKHQVDLKKEIVIFIYEN